MQRTLFLGVVLLLTLFLIAACGEAAPDPTATSAPTAMPQAAAAESATLEAYAAKFAGRPGAIYVGDLNQLVGPAPSVEQGDFDGNVPLDALQRHLWITSRTSIRACWKRLG